MDDLYTDFDIPDDSLPPDEGMLVPCPSSGHRLPNRWDPRLVMDLALGVDGLDELLARYQLTEEELSYLTSTETFRRELSLAIRTVKEEGISFKTKAKIQAEVYLDTLDDIVNSKNTPASTKLDAIKSVVKWAALEPKNDTVDSTTATQINVNISF